MDSISPGLARNTLNEPGTQIKCINPQELLHPARLDIAVKSLYALSLLGYPSQNSAINPEGS